MSGGSQDQGAQLNSRQGPEFSRRGFLGGTLLTTFTKGPTAVASLMVPDVTETLVNPRQALLTEVWVGSVPFFTPRFKKFLGDELLNVVTPHHTAEQVEEAVLAFVTKRVTKHCCDLKNLSNAVRRLEDAPDGQTLIGDIRRDVQELRQAEIAKKVANVSEAVSRIKHAIGTEVQHDSPLWHINLAGLSRNLTPEQRAQMQQITPQEVIDHIHHFDFTVDVATTYQHLIDLAVFDASWGDSESEAAMKLQVLRDRTQEQYGLYSALLRVVARAVDYCPQAFANPASLVPLPEDGRHEAIPCMAHTGFLRIPADALELYKNVAAPGGVWISSAHQQAFYKLKDSLDQCLHDLAEETMQRHFPDYMRSESRERRNIEERIKDRAERAAERQRAMFAWSGVDFSGNDYY